MILENIIDEKTLNYLKGFKHFSTEKVIKSITNELTENDEWSVKGKEMGKCWYEDCCVMEQKSYSRRKCGSVQGSSGKGKFSELANGEEVRKAIELIDF